MKNFLENIKDELEQTSNDYPVVTVSRKDLKLLISLYEDLLRRADLEKL